MTQDQLRDLMMLYVVDGLDDDERATVEALLRQRDPSALAALAQAHDTVSQIAMSLDPVPPEPRMWDRLQQQIKGTDPVGPVGLANKRGEGSAAFWRNAVLWRNLAIAALIACAVLSWAWISALRSKKTLQNQLGDQLAHATAQVERIRTQLTAQEQLTKSQQAQLTQQAERLSELQSQVARANQSLALVSSPGLQTVAVAGTDAMPKAKGRLLWDAEQRLLSFAAKLSPLGEDQAYELWFVTDPGGAVSLGTFTVDATGQTQVIKLAPGELTEIKAVAVSLEPSGGSKAQGPSGPVVMMGAMQ